MRGLALASAALAAACGTVPAEMRVMVEPPAYAVTMSSTLGLGLTPVSEPPPGMKVRYRWTADGGYFRIQSEATNEIVDLGRETVTGGGKLFWSYKPDEQKALEDRPVAITVVTENAKNGEALAWTDMALVWDGQFFRPKH
ncbi:MAG: hypothetical protein PHS14_15235 [Elusimicrobia bacterium]|nr:hypothetical protein [Elusimicrobiota bacterium]